jgi:hypothetical protein
VIGFCDVASLDLVEILEIIEIADFADLLDTHHHPVSHIIKFDISMLANATDAYMSA